jgi:hypothetical protein
MMKLKLQGSFLKLDEHENDDKKASKYALV